MSFSTIAEPEQLFMLREFHAGICTKLDIDPTSLEGEEVATLVLAMFNDGARTLDELKAQLDKRNTTHLMGTGKRKPATPDIAAPTLRARRDDGRSGQEA